MMPGTLLLSERRCTINGGNIHQLNKEEEKILKRLADYFHEDRSTLVKKSLFELYENMVDLKEIKEFESRECRGKESFFTA